MWLTAVLIMLVLTVFCLIHLTTANGNALLRRRALPIEELCTNGAMRPVIQLSPTTTISPSAISLSFGENIAPWRSVFFDCTITVKMPTDDDVTALGIGFSHLQMRIGAPFECPDYIEVNDRQHALRLCGELPATPETMPHFDSNSSSLTIHVFSRTATPWQHNVPPFRFRLSIFSYYKVTHRRECAARGGVYCIGSHHCLPHSLVCNGFISCIDGTEDPTNLKNCSSSIFRTQRGSSTEHKLAPLTITIVASAMFLIIFLLVGVLLWMRRKFIAKRCRTSSNQDLTDDPIGPTDPGLFAVPRTRINASGSGMNPSPGPSQFPPPSLLLTPTPSFGLVTSNEAPPTYESLFGYTNPMVTKE